MNDLQKNQNSELSIFNPQSMQQLTAFAEMMSNSVIAVPEHLRGKPADCMAVAMQAVQWNMNPYAVAQKTHIVNGKLGYEAQLVSAVIGSSRAISGRFKYDFCGEWEGFSASNKDTEKGLGVRCGAVLAGESEITWGHWIYLNTITTRNSPLWKTNPQQQIQYLATKYWSRIYTPDVILGVYDAEEIDSSQRQEREINPRSASDLNASFSQAPQEKKPQKEKTVIVDGAVVDGETGEIFEPTKFEVVRDFIMSAKDRDDYKNAREMFTDAVSSKAINEDQTKTLNKMMVDLYNALK